MKHQYLVESKQEGLPKEGLCTVSCTRDTVKNLVGEFLTYKLDKEGSLKTKVMTRQNLGCLCYQNKKATRD